MSHRPHPNGTPTPKYIRLTDELAARIEKGEWADGRIPTVRQIAVEYQVSSFTASRAMHILQQRGLVITRLRDGCYVAPPPVVGDRWAVVLRLTPGPGRDATAAAVRAGFDRIAVAARQTFVPVSLGHTSADGPTDPTEAVRAVEVAGVRGVVFLPSRVSEAAARQDEVFLVGCRQLGVPVVLMDRNLRGHGRPPEADLVSPDHFDAGAACTRHLLGLGRRRVACVVGSPTSSHTDRLAGYLTAVQGVADPLVLREPDGMTAPAVYGWLADQVAAHRADGVVCYRDPAAVGLMLELVRRGVNVPQEVTVTGCGDLPLGDSYSLGVTTYSYPAVEVARWAVRLLRQRIDHPDEPPARVQLPGRLVVRNSTAG